MNTTGIYALYFEPDKVYIGQSLYIETRYRKHKEMLKSGRHYNYKLSEAYVVYNTEPELQILEMCKSSDLDRLEIHYIKEFDSVNNGYNILWGGNSSSGVSASRSKYSKEEVLSVFTLLTDDRLTNKDISELTELPLTLVESIAYNKRHKWLAEEFPDIRSKIDYIINNNLRSKECNNYNARNGVIYTVIDPNGVEHKFSNIARFAEEHGLNRSHLNQLILGKELQHKKWRKGVSDVL